ncbi:hypothetical protein H2203_001741 [Taxawa tesnikishii (nom. ined.)]|nr:hypothetical protein H2203_001741 [Dothideales sp. JES 119]
MPSEDPNAELSRAEYWDKRYSDNAPSYDWLRNFDTVKPFLTKHLPPASSAPKIVHMGNGNSTLPASLLSLPDSSYTSQTAIDFSPVVIANMSAAHPGIEWRVMDIRALEFANGSFDVCIDKATLDAMLYGSLWDPEDEVRDNVKRYVDEIARVLKPGGLWLYITWRQPHFIRPLIQRPEVWSVEVETLADGGKGFDVGP